MDVETLGTSIYMEFPCYDPELCKSKGKNKNQILELPPPYMQVTRNATNSYKMITLVFDRMVATLMFIIAVSLFYAVTADRSMLLYSWCAYGTLEAFNICVLVPLKDMSNANITVKDIQNLSRAVICVTISFVCFKAINSEFFFETSSMS